MPCALKQPLNLCAWNASAKFFCKDEHSGKILVPISTFCNFIMGMGEVNENREKDGVCLWKQDKGSDTTAAVRNHKSLCCCKLRSRNVILAGWVGGVRFLSVGHK